MVVKIGKRRVNPAEASVEPRVNKTVAPAAVSDKPPAATVTSKCEKAKRAKAIFNRYWAEQRSAPKNRQAANREKAKARNEQIVIRRLQKLAAKKAEKQAA